MSDLSCITEASCAPGDHTYSWPCVLAQMPQRRNPIGEVICAVLLPVVEVIGWAKELPARVDAWLARASDEEDEL